MRVRLDLTYDGTDFHGWAAQPGLRTVEGVLTEALGTLTRVPVHLTVAGRTDAGVHAASQVAHVDLPRTVWEALPGRSDRTPSDALAARLAALLARESAGRLDCVVRSAQVVPATFDARFSALGRHYRYLLADDPAAWVPTRRDVTWHRHRLDVARMAAAAPALLGEHDFLPFAKPREGATTIRTLRRLDVTRTPDGLVAFRLHADAFCHSQVRFMVGALMRVGAGNRPVTWIADVLEAGVRDSAVPLARPEGLTLERVDYPDPAGYAAQVRRAKVVRTLPPG